MADYKTKIRRNRTMKQMALIGIGFAITLGIVLQIDNLYAQHMGRGMMQGVGCYERDISIPEKLQKPKNEEWVSKLQQILALENLSQLQYEADSKKYQVHMPYRMVIPQEENHIEWIKKLFAAYGLPSDVKVQPIKETTTLTQAYENARELEKNLIPQYEWLINNAENNTTKEVLDTILLQTRIHYTMFDHALHMGWMRGQGMGPGGERWYDAS